MSTENADLVVAALGLLTVIFGLWAFYVRNVATSAKDAGNQFAQLRGTITALVDLRLDAIAKQLSDQTETLKTLCKDFRSLEVENARRLAILEEKLKKNDESR